MASGIQNSAQPPVLMVEHLLCESGPGKRVGTFHDSFGFHVHLVKSPEKTFTGRPSCPLF